MILIIEDDCWFASSLQQTLLAALPATTIVTIDNPGDAMTMIDSGEEVEAIVADFHLGDQNIITLFNELASYDDTRTIPKIILSSSGRKLSLSDMSNFGVVAIFDKTTYDASDLIKTIMNLRAEER